MIRYVRSQLAERFGQAIPIYPYSTRRGFEKWKHAFEDELLEKAAGDVASQRCAIYERKLATLLTDCEQYIRLTLRSAEMLDTERSRLEQQFLAEKEALGDTRLEVRLIAQHAAAGTRAAIERALAPCERPIRQKLLAMLEEQAGRFPHRLSKLLDVFSDWLHDALSSELLAISASKRSEFVQPLADVQRQYQRVLQNFRDRLSDRTLALYGVPLKTTEPDIVPQPPKMPDVSIGKAFDHNWELLSPVLPMTILRAPVFGRFRRKIEDETYKNLSRLTAQWEQIVNAAIFELRREAEKRMDELLATVQGLVSASSESAPQIRADLKRLELVAGASQDSRRIEHRPL